MYIMCLYKKNLIQQYNKLSGKHKVALSSKPLQDVFSKEHSFMHSLLHEQ